jgi:hypothetical protein
MAAALERMGMAGLRGVSTTKQCGAHMRVSCGGASLWEGTVVDGRTDWWDCNLNQTDPDWNVLPLSIRIEYLYKCVNV